MADLRVTPRPDEIAVVRLECGEAATVVRVDGEQTFRGGEPVEVEGQTYREVRVYVVPFDGPRCGWHGQGWSEGGPRVGNGKHRIDRPVWKEAEKLLKAHRAVYVRVEEQPYYNKTRHTAAGVRVAEEPARD